MEEIPMYSLECEITMGYTGSLLFGGTYTKSAESDFKVSDKGVETKSINLLGFNGGATGSRTIIFYNSKNR
ncbi:hypothetical protein J2Y38_004841 [Flavobacterium sp. 2755]|uniref:hypothetical protein n=1 Tax=Flavobacterium sp. 2755 TaxID=2817765 RepID=UPI0028545B83|nr:hypothetical protein [Flavobacterium sp. 2755]MDR6764607.1 hypothetical protein [Flavobacterium sp. 2755]